MTDELFCPVHGDLQAKIAKIEGRQDARHCQAHEAQIGGLVDDITRIDRINESQWTKIDRLTILVYSAGPITALLAFLGSLLGAYLKGK